MVLLAVDVARLTDLTVAIAKLNGYIAALSGVPAAARTAAQSASLATYRARLADYAAEVAALQIKQAEPTPFVGILEKAPVSGALWGCAGHQVNLFTATYAAILASVTACNPRAPAPERSDYANDIFRQALELRGAKDLIDTVQSAFSGMTSGLNVDVGGFLRGILAQGSAALTAVVAALKGAATAAATSVAEAPQGIFDAIGGALGGLIGGAGDALGGIVGQVQSSIGSLIGGAGSALGGIVSSVTSGIGTIVGGASDVLGGIVSTVAGGVGGLLDQALSGAGQVVGGVVSGLGALIGGAGDALGAIVGTVQRHIAGLLRGIGEVVDELASKAAGIPGALVDIGTTIVEGFTGAFSPALEAFGGLISHPTDGLLGGFFGAEVPELTDRIDAVLRRMEANPHVPGDVKQLSRPGLLPAIPIMGLIAAFLVVPLLHTAISTLIAPAMTLAQQEEYKAVRPSLLPLGDMTAAVRRDERSEVWLADQAARLGYRDDDIALAVKLTRSLLDPASLTDMLRRKVISEGEWSKGLTDLGYDESDVARLARIRDIVPGPSDLVRFAVRDAFPGQVEYEGAGGAAVPGGFVEAGKLVGLTPEWARSYWAAHWELPSVSMALEMYHRGIISLDRLKGLIRQADFAPEWRDEMVEVAFNPLTRVDIRRMYGAGVLNAGGVERAYRDIGYSPERAAQLREFTVKLEAAAGAADTSAQRDLTRADLVGAYADGILTRDAAGKHLRELGYDIAETELILDREDLAIVRSRRKEAKAAIVAQASAGVLTDAQTQDALARAGYTQVEVSAVLVDIDAKRRGHVTLPSKADLAAFVKAKLIDEAEWRDGLSVLGYSSASIDHYVALGASKAAALAAKEG